MFVPSFTFAATAEVVPLVGATPVFVDIDAAHLQHRPGQPEARRSARPNAGPHAAAGVIAVDLFGLPADYDRDRGDRRRRRHVGPRRRAQGFGGTIDGRVAGALRPTDHHLASSRPSRSAATATAARCSPTTTSSPSCSIRCACTARAPTNTTTCGSALNSRLDTLQAAILSVKLAVYADEIDARNAVAARYTQHLSNLVETPYIPAGYGSVWAQYTVKMSSQEERAAVQDALKAAGIPTMVYYVLPLHQQSIYADYPADPQGMKVAEDLAQRVLSLPMHPYLDAPTQERIIDAVGQAVTDVRG